jgi:hypothetical protein
MFSLLRHFSKRYRCGMRASDMMEEMCYRAPRRPLPPPPLHISLMDTYAVTQIPLNAPAHLSRVNQMRGKAHLWLGRERAQPDSVVGQCGGLLRGWPMRRTWTRTAARTWARCTRPRPCSRLRPALVAG